MTLNFFKIDWKNLISKVLNFFKHFLHQPAKGNKLSENLFFFSPTQTVPSELDKKVLQFNKSPNRQGFAERGCKAHFYVHNNFPTRKWLIS